MGAFLHVKGSWIHWKGPWIWHWKVLESEMSKCVWTLLHLALLLIILTGRMQCNKFYAMYHELKFNITFLYEPKYFHLLMKCHFCLSTNPVFFFLPIHKTQYILTIFCLACYMFNPINLFTIVCIYSALWCSFLNCHLPLYSWLHYNTCTFHFLTICL